MEGVLKAQMHRVHDLGGIVHKANNHSDGNNNSNYNNIDGNNSTTFHCEEFASIINALSAL